MKIIELVGAPASGKSYMLKQCIEKCENKKYYFPDITYIKKTKIKRLIFLLIHSYYLTNAKYIQAKKIIKKVDGLSNRKFYLKQFMIDYILLRFSEKKHKNKIIVFSENLVNISTYIFGKHQSKENNHLFERYINLLKANLQRSLVIRINTNADDNLLYKSKRYGVDKNEYEKTSNFYKDYKANDLAFDYIISSTEMLFDRIEVIENSYSDKPINELFCLLNMF